MQILSYVKIGPLGNRVIWRSSSFLAEATTVNVFLRLFEINGDGAQFFYGRRAMYWPFTFQELFRGRVRLSFNSDARSVSHQ